MAAVTPSTFGALPHTGADAPDHPAWPTLRAVVTLGERRAQNERRSPENKRQWVRCPPRRAHATTCWSRTTSVSRPKPRRAATTATPPTVRTARRASSPRGIAAQLPHGELSPVDAPPRAEDLAVSALPKALSRRGNEECGSILVIEEASPWWKKWCAACCPRPVAVKGRLTGELPRHGRADARQRARSARAARHEAHAASEGDRAPRPPALCQGCGHRDMYTIN